MLSPDIAACTLGVSFGRAGSHPFAVAAALMLAMKLFLSSALTPVTPSVNIALEAI
jgi:hypothetical protein